MNSLPTNPEVIVIGAGAAGMAAADALAKAGVDVVVLEAAGHVGGRCYTDKNQFAQPFDMGGAWFHSAEINPLARLAEQRGARLYKKQWTYNWAWTDEHNLTDAELEDFTSEHLEMWKAVRLAGKEPVDQTPYQVTPNSCWKKAAKHWIAQMQGGDSDVTSVQDIVQYDSTEGNWLVQGGLGDFVKSLFPNLPIKLNCAVTKIDTTGSEIHVETTEGTLNAKHVIVTVSTGVLAAENIQFVPDLPPEKRDAINQLPNGLLNKVGLDFDPSWKRAVEGEMADYHTSDDEFCTILFGFFETDLAVGFVAGRFADQLELEGKGAATEFCLEGLKNIFGNGVTKYIRATNETAWRATPNALGAYSYARPGGAGARKVLAAPIDEKLYFAGEATSTNSYATVHGAYQSGIDVAKDVLASRAMS
ncbi:MAG: NAD(P)/FAD-dependent oxidoreductase [Paracoccaceae bacterium]|nr:NAD(P)/FAD-dependent oxidoreductase [Paracoccaceae bacterium]MDG1737670.1 NAD(P)/FAD-dependent oxidoreductase [Paracoccaceae bacterium]MDG2257651.1 NAD(P)/FAD-dependent oxidoreductase [Paracoccaceae bacterium]